MVTAPERHAASHPGPWTECPAGPRQRGRLGWIRGSHAERRGLLLPTVAEHVGAPQPAPCSCSARVCRDLEVPSKSPQSQFCCAAHPRINIPLSQNTRLGCENPTSPICCHYRRPVGRGAQPPLPSPVHQAIGCSPEVPADRGRGTADRGVPWPRACSARPSPAMAAQFPDKRSRDGPVTFIYFHSVGAPELLIHKNFWHVLSVNEFVYI